MRRRSASLLIELVVVVAIIALLAGAYLGLSKKGSKGEKSTPKAAMDKAHGVECIANLQQAKALLQMQVSDEGHYPATIDTTNPIFQCPVTHKAYIYSPNPLTAPGDPHQSPCRSATMCPSCPP